MALGLRQFGRTNLISLQGRTGEEGISGTLEGVGTTLGNRIDATTSKSALAHIVWGDRNGHLVEGLE